MFKNNSITLWQKLGTGMGMGCLIGAASWLGLLLLHAYAWRDTLASTPQAISIGPLQLHTIAKLPTAEGYVVQFTWETGLLVYGVVWLVIGAVVVAGRYLAALPKQSDSAG